jgi:hypothetical protein
VYRELKDVVAAIDPADAVGTVDRGRIDSVKFGSCVPDPLLEEMLTGRDADEDGVATLIAEPVLFASMD